MQKVKSFLKSWEFFLIILLAVMCLVFKITDASRIASGAQKKEIFYFANVLRSMSSDTPVSVMLPGSVAQEDESIWVPDEAGIQKRMQELFPADTWNKPEEE